MNEEPVGRLGLVDFTDGTLFGNDAGEDELPDVLNSYFVDQPAFKAFFSRGNSFRVARSRKGMGKSALISKLAYDLARDPSRPLVINITGAKLLGLGDPPQDRSHLSLQNYWMRVICARINYALANEVGFAFTETNMALVESAEIAGFKKRNIVGALLQRVKSSKIPIEITIKEYSNHEELLRRAITSFHDTNVWLLVDDIDSTYVDTPEQRALLSTFFSACRAIVREMEGLSIRASVRTDVWSALRDNEDLDKCEQYVSDIQWTAAELKTILSKKIFSYLERTGVLTRLINIRDYKEDADLVLEVVFEEKMKWGSSRVPPFRPVHILSAGRPRWMSQLCRLSGVQAAKSGKAIIEKADINAIEKVYSRLRLNDIYKEHSHQYDGLERLIETFSNCPARYTTTDLLSQIAVKYINMVGSGNIPHLDGMPYRYPLQLAHFLYKVGFIVGRQDHAGQVGNADFARYEERPELLIDGRNPDDGMLWEVHPAYREALSIGRLQRSAAGAERRLASSKRPKETAAKGLAKDAKNRSSQRRRIPLRTAPSTTD